MNKISSDYLSNFTPRAARKEASPSLWKTFLIGLLLLNPVAYATRPLNCPAPYTPIQQLCPAGAMPPVTREEMRRCIMIMSGSPEWNERHCRDSTKALQPYNQWRRAIEVENVKQVKLLWDYGIDHYYTFPEAFDKLFYTDQPTDSLYSIFETLLQGGIDPNQLFTTRRLKPYNAPGLTHLYRYEHKMEKMMDLFLKYGANPLVKDSEGLTAIDYAIQDENTHFIEKFGKL